MKLATSFLFVTLSFAVVMMVPEEIRNMWDTYTQPIRSKCICSSGVEQTLAERTFVKAEFPNNACLKCYLKCLAETKELLNPDGSFILDKVAAEVAGVNITIVTDCSGKVDRMLDLCEKTYQFAKCLSDALSK